MQKKQQSVLLTGGCGYIGKICHHYLLSEGYQVHIVDDLSSGNLPLSNKHFSPISLHDVKALRTLFASTRFDLVVHLAAKIQVAESVSDPIGYYHNNLTGLINLLNVMNDCDVHRIIFSSSAAVYGSNAPPSIPENSNTVPSNPYGRSKLQGEQILIDAAQQGIKSIILRLFNVAGALPVQQLGECHQPETHLIPLVVSKLFHQQPISIYGGRYPTPDGTCIRDYVHVLDVVRAIHACTSSLLEDQGMGVYNIGSSQGTSVLEVVRQAADLIGVSPILQLEHERPGDAPMLVSDTSLFTTRFSWAPLHSDIERVLQDSIDYQRSILEDKRSASV